MKLFKENVLYVLLLLSLVSFSVGLSQSLGVQSQVTKNRELIQSNTDLIQNIKRCRAN